MVFTPNSETLEASRICTCELYISDYGSCSLFEELQLSVQSLNKVSLRDNFLPEDISNYEGSAEDFILPDTFCAIPADNNSPDTIWFIQIIKEDEAVSEVMDDLGHMVAGGYEIFQGFLSRAE